MASDILSQGAEEDLRDIAKYTLDNLGKAQLNLYRQVLKKKFEGIAQGNLVSRVFSNNLPQVKFTKAGSHFIFYLTQATSVPIIIGVIHENRDIVKHLTSRLLA